MYKKNENFAVIVVKYEWNTPKVNSREKSDIQDYYLHIILEYYIS